MKFKREEFLRDTALVQLGLTRISKSPLNIINYSILTLGLCFGLNAGTVSFAGAKGSLVLYALTSCNILYIALYSFAYFSRVISEEKQNKTMTLLRLTPVNEKNIFYGKLLPPFINLIMMLIFQLPIILLTITLGGVSFLQVFKVYILLLLIAACFASLGAWVSSSNPENWLAHFNFIFVFFGIAVLYGAIQFLYMYELTQPIIEFINTNNPFTKCYLVIHKKGESILVSCIFSLSALALGLKLAFKSFLKHIDFDEVSPPEIKQKTKSYKRRVNFGKSPLIQKEFYFGCGGRRTQIVIFVVLTLFGGLFYSFNTKKHYYYSSEPSALTQILLINLTCLALFVIYTAGNSFKREKTDKTWSDLLLSPLSPYQLINHKIMGSVKFILPMAIAIILLLLIRQKQTLTDLKLLLENYRFSYIVPAYFLLTLCIFILIQLFEKVPTAISVYILPASFGLIVAIDKELYNYNDLSFLLICNVSCLGLAALAYFLSAKIIERSSHP